MSLYWRTEKGDAHISRNRGQDVTRRPIFVPIAAIVAAIGGKEDWIAKSGNLLLRNVPANRGNLCSNANFGGLSLCEKNLSRVPQCLASATQ